MTTTTTTMILFLFCKISNKTINKHRVSICLSRFLKISKRRIIMPLTSSFCFLLLLLYLFFDLRKKIQNTKCQFNVLIRVNAAVGLSVNVLKELDTSSVVEFFLLSKENLCDFSYKNKVYDHLS
jgi:hypothetical protein